MRVGWVLSLKLLLLTLSGAMPAHEPEAFDPTKDPEAVIAYWRPVLGPALAIVAPGRWAPWLGMMIGAGVNLRLEDGEGRALSGVEVTAKGPRAYGAAGRTDREGRLEIRGLNRDSMVELRAELTGYQLSRFGPASTVALRPARPFTLRLHRERRIVGRLVDENGAAVAETRVAMSDAMSAVAEAVSSVDGYFSFAAAPSDRELLLDVKGQGFAAARRQVDADPVDLDLGAWALETEILRQGMVVDHEGMPVAGASLYLHSPGTRLDMLALGPRNSEVWTRTDAAGRFELRGLPRGKMVLEARAEGLLPAFVRIEERAQREFSIVLERGIWVRGTVRRGTEVIADAGLYGSGRWTRTDTEGRFALGPFEPGNLGISAGSGHSSAEIYLREVSSDVDGLELQLKDDPGPVTIEGWVIGPDGKGAAGARVTIHVSDLAFSHDVGSDGAFKFEGIEPGENQLYITHPELSPAAVAIEVGRESEPFVIRLEEQRRATLKVRVGATDGLPIRGALVKLRPGNYRHDFKELAGRSDGAGEVSLSTEHYGSFDLKVEAHDAAPVSLRVELAPDETRQVEVRLEPAAYLRCRLTGLAPKEPVVVSLSGEPLFYIVLPFDPESQAYLSPELAKGAYRLRVKAGLYAFIERTVDITRGGQVYDVVVDWSEADP